LDEATSALDNQTEKAVMDAVNNIGKNITIIIIAHRLSTIKNCDLIFLLDNGELKKKGTFEELIKVDDQFRKNAKYL
jgi:ABC-type multidrug transport system fused ATPase/permease subunit